ncbi:MAG: DUF5005 domain-containing protein [Bacteroidaceae bacterium]|nr:DUF5005 domain-containing protein [Bacteroidaceae bacterium]
MKKIYIALLGIMLQSGSICAQSFDFYQDGLKDLYLDYLNTLSKDKVVEVYRDVTYWNLFGMREKGWNGGLRNVSMPLPDGNCLWMHTDSYFGRISEIRDRAHYNNRVNNAAQIQTGEKSPCDFVALNEYISTDKNYPATYYMAYDWIRHPDATLSQDYLQMGFVDDKHILHPLDGTLIKSGSDVHAQILFLSYNENKKADGLYFAEYAIAGEPHQKGYVQLLNTRRLPFVVDFGRAILEDGNHNYLYGLVKISETGYDLVVARSQTRSLLSTWEYYVVNKNGIREWQTELPTIEDLKKSKINGVSKVCSPSVFKYGGAYYLVSQPSRGGQIQISKGDNPWGPFKAQVKLYMPSSNEKVACEVAVHPHLSRIGELVLSYSIDHEPIIVYTAKEAGGLITETYLTTDQRNRYGWGSANLAVPHFLRIFNWQKLLSAENVGPITDAGLEVWDIFDNIETPIKNTLHIYPTVMEDVLNIETDRSETHSWSICSAGGNIVMHGDVSGHRQISVGSLPSGIYIVSVNGMGNTKVVKRN